jgi:hypothetical protein
MKQLSLKMLPTYSTNPSPDPMVRIEIFHYCVCSINESKNNFYKKKEEKNFFYQTKLRKSNCLNDGKFRSLTLKKKKKLNAEHLFN